jgi:cytochrome b
MRESREQPNPWQGDGDRVTIVTNSTDGLTAKAAAEVWDQAVRVLYASLAVYLIVAYATGDQAGLVHVVVGYTIAIHLVLRIVWGLAAQYHAQSDQQSCSVVRPPHQVLPHLRPTERRAALAEFGRHPAGAAMIGAFLTNLGCICITGAMMTTDAFREARWLQDLHATLASVAVGLAVVYFLGWLVTRVSSRESLVKTDDHGTRAALTAKRRTTAFSVDMGSPGDAISTGNAVDSKVDACPCRRTGFTLGSSPRACFAGTCFRRAVANSWGR